MKTNVFLLTMFILAAMFTPSSAQKKNLGGVSHGNTKAYTGEEDAGQLETLHLSIIENEEVVVDITMMFGYNFYEVKYNKEGKTDYMFVGSNEALELQEALSQIYKHEDYYQKYESKKGKAGLEWLVQTKHKNASFLMEGKGVDYSHFAIITFLMSHFDYIFEYTSPNKPFPEGKLLYFHYSHKGSMRPGGPEWTVERMDDGKYKVTYLNDMGKYMGEEAEKKSITCDSSIGEELCEIFRQGKIQNYKSRYSNPAVLDGSSWNFEAKFEGGTWIRSGGYMAGPRNRSGINNSLKYLEELMGMK